MLLSSFYLFLSIINTIATVKQYIASAVNTPYLNDKIIAPSTTKKKLKPNIIILLLF